MPISMSQPLQGTTRCKPNSQGKPWATLGSDPLIPWNPREPSASHCDMGAPPVLAPRSRAGRPCHNESPRKYHLISSTPQCRPERIRSSGAMLSCPFGAVWPVLHLPKQIRMLPRPKNTLEAKIARRDLLQMSKLQRTIGSLVRVERLNIILPLQVRKEVVPPFAILQTSGVDLILNQLFIETSETENMILCSLRRILAGRSGLHQKRPIT